MLPAGFTLGEYWIESLLGRGAMGAVYRGWRNGAAQPVAIKTINTDLLVGTGRDALLARFRQEAMIGMRLRHPSIVQVYDCDEQDGIIYIAMELIEGQELGHLLDANPALPLAMRLAIVLQILNALTYTHQQGIIHRDIKPANVMVRTDYSIALADFGIAHVDGSQMTQLGELLGSPLYMSPEQLRGQAIDHRSDLFSVGVLLYFLLTKKRPFNAESLAALIQKILSEKPPPPSALNTNISRAYDPILQRALEKDRRLRFPNANEFAKALRQARTQADEDAQSLASTVLVAATAPGEHQDDLAATQLPEEQSLLSLIDECLQRRVHEEHLERLTALLAHLEQLALSQTLQNSLPISALTAQILNDAPLLGRKLHRARGDWLELVRLFALLAASADRLGIPSQIETARTQIVEQLTAEVAEYTDVLSAMLFSSDGPPLLRIANDFNRLDLLQFALEQLDVQSEVRQVRQALRMFASQVIGRINAMLSQFLVARDAVLGFDVANLLLEVEELIVIAERLCEDNMAISTSQPGGRAMRQFIANAQALSQMLAEQLMQHVHREYRQISAAETPDCAANQALFLGQLRQLGLLYRFVAYWQTGQGPMAELHDWTCALHNTLKEVTTLLFVMLAGVDGVGETSKLLWARLTTLADFAEQFNWTELLQQILVAARTQAQAALQD